MLNQQLCPLCQQPNACASAQNSNAPKGENTVTDCWCFRAAIDPEALARIPPDELNKACICQNCATQQNYSTQ